MRATAAAAPQASGSTSWEASLELAFEEREGRSVLATRRHRGPLRVQRTFYPERDGTCHCYVLHPPGGIVGGDRLEAEVHVAPSARAVLTAPAATKVYRSGGARAEQRIHLRVARGAVLEWLPQETIIYDGAALKSGLRVELETGAAFLGWELTCLGRPASQERFTYGALEQHVQVFRDGRPLVIERAHYAGGGQELSAGWGLQGKTVTGSLWCVAPDGRPIEDETLEALRSALSAEAGRDAACTQLRDALVCRYLGDGVERGLRTLRAAWSVLRPACFGKPAVPPRIWAT